MKRRLGMSIRLFILLIILSSCSQDNEINQSAQESAASNNPTAKQVLEGEPDADIFVLNNIVYSNAEQIDWVQDLDIKAGEAVGEIKSTYTPGMPFVEGTATRLSPGTIIYTSEPWEGAILIAEVDGAEIRYYGLIEG